MERAEAYPLPPVTPQLHIPADQSRQADPRLHLGEKGRRVLPWRRHVLAVPLLEPPRVVRPLVLHTTAGLANAPRRSARDAGRNALLDQSGDPAGAGGAGEGRERQGGGERG